MEKIQQTITINAPVEKVWNTMLTDATYRDWTAAFNPGSYYVGNWEEGSKILFLGPSPSGDGEGGMVSRIKENRLHEYISIEHLGIINNGIEDTTSEMTKEWAGAMENYTFKDVNGNTELTIESNITPSEKKAMEGAWKKALIRLKELAEA